jgi:transcriptional regulator with GAF, ATPase, and Fis domain
LREAVRSALQHGDIIAESAAMKRVLEQVRAVARTDSSVLILGESGVGKELIAAAVHDLSARRDGPLVKVNCASVPRELFESEFFGHVRGAFSGAARDRQGRFLLADGGSLFLDEVGEIPLELQGKLLRVLQERTFEAVGDDHTREVDVRVIAATNRPLDVEVDAGRFRRDLFYRLNVLPIEVPPLRQRREDVLPMARQFLRTAAHRLHLGERRLSEDDERALLGYDFPGNVRELQNVIERAVVLGELGDLGLSQVLGRHRQPVSAPSLDAVPEPGEVLTESALRDLERRNIMNALRRCDYRIAGERGAARMLGLSPSTLAYRMKHLGLERPR